MCVIGLTGSLGTGKSTVAKLFADLGAKVLNADTIAHQQLKPSGKCFRAVVRIFGKDILKAGRIDRRKLASCVFTNVRQLRKLEGIIHPAVRNEILKKIRRLKKRKRKEVVIIDVPLLFESKFHKFVDYAIVVKASQRTQIERATKKLGMTKADALRRIKAQMSLRQKIRLADMIIDNNGSLKQTKTQVKRIWEKL